MKVVIILVILSFVWLAYEVWRAPHIEEMPDGSIKTIKPEKKFLELFKKRKK
jgi:hypothetical protein